MPRAPAALGKAVAAYPSQRRRFQPRAPARLSDGRRGGASKPARGPGSQGCRRGPAGPPSLPMPRAPAPAQGCPTVAAAVLPAGHRRRSPVPTLTHAARALPARGSASRAGREPLPSPTMPRASPSQRSRRRPGIGRSTPPEYPPCPRPRKPARLSVSPRRRFRPGIPPEYGCCHGPAAALTAGHHSEAPRARAPAPQCGRARRPKAVAAAVLPAGHRRRRGAPDSAH